MNNQDKNKNRTKCEVWTRVMGYHRPVSSWNKGKQSEFYERLNFKEELIKTECQDGICKCSQLVA